MPPELPRQPLVCLAWLITGKTVGGLSLYPRHQCVDRDAALRLWTDQVTWFSNEEATKGRIQVGRLADLLVPDRDFFAAGKIAGASSLLTLLGGRIVYGAGDRAYGEDPPPPAMPNWSPVCSFGEFASRERAEPSVTPATVQPMACALHGNHPATAWTANIPTGDPKSFWGGLGCACWAF